MSPTPSEKDCAKWPKWLLENHSKIILGEKANLGDIPWQAQLLYNGRHLCGGTLISPKHVLTANHCVMGETGAEDLTIITGRLSDSKHEETQVTSKVAKIFGHDNFGQPVWPNNDIALLELEEPIQFNEFIKMACIGTTEPIDGITAIVSGWGRGSNHALHWTNLTIVPRDKCQEIFDSNPLDKPGNLEITDGMLCAADNDGKPSSGCFGDSGG